MVSQELPKAPCGKLIAAVLLLTVASGCVLVCVHAEYVHGSALLPDKCVVCSWAKSLATIGASAACVAVVFAAVRVAPPPIAISYPFCYRLPLSARSPPRTV
jgi:hypothetical protein